MPLLPRAWYCYRAGGIQCDAHHGMNQEHAIFGGSRCYTVSPSDTAPALIALDATVRIHGETERETPIQDLFIPPSENITVMHRVAPAEVLSEVTVPLREGTRSTFIKYAMRNSWDFAIASVGAALRVEGGIARGVRIALGGVAPVPWRAIAAEREVEGQPLDATRIESLKDTRLTNKRMMPPIASSSAVRRIGARFRLEAPEWNSPHGSA